MQVTADAVSPGRLTRIAVVEPPYCARQQKTEEHHRRHDARERPPAPRHRRLLPGPSASGYKERAEANEDCAEHGREVPRAHAHRRAERIVARDDDRHYAEDEKDQTGE